jgi:hypothetical protein
LRDVVRCQGLTCELRLRRQSAEELLGHGSHPPCRDGHRVPRSFYSAGSIFPNSIPSRNLDKSQIVQIPVTLTSTLKTQFPKETLCGLVVTGSKGRPHRCSRIVRIVATRSVVLDWKYTL